MAINTSINLQVVGWVAEGLGELRKEMLFVGGAVSSLYATAPEASDPRPTKDIDVSVQIGSYAEMNQLSEILQTKGFHPAPESTVMYRYKFNQVLVDFIPFEATSLGPTNSWLKPGFKVAETYDLDGLEINILPVAYYLATKWEAFWSRGKADPLLSHDLEDFIYVVDYNIGIVESIQSSDEKVKTYLKQAFDYLLGLPNTNELIEAQLIPSIALERRKMIVEKMRAIITK